MWKSGKFVNDVSITDVRKSAKSKGYTLTPDGVRKALLRLEFITKGKKVRGIQHYTQKYPPSTELSQDKNPLHIQIFEQLNLHPQIKMACEKLFRDGHNQQAITEAFKKVNNLVKKKSGETDKDGKNLMLHVFSRNSPILKLNDMKTVTDKDEQEGFMHLFAGGMEGIRNPLVHDDTVEEDPLKTIEYLCLASILAKKVDKSSK